MNAPGETLTSEQVESTYSKMRWRLMPLLFICYIIAYVDRINVGFAKLQLQSVLGVPAETWGKVYGLGAGLFFIGYFIFEVPSNIILHRVGARIWIARIMILWGIVSICFMFLKSVKMFYFMRFLLGAAEAGFFPGVILYLTYWFPAKERAKTIALFALGGVAAGVIGSPISGALLKLDGMGGLGGWQWLFLLEGIPAVLLGVYVLKVLPNGPREVSWLTENEKSFLSQKLAAEEAEPGNAASHSFAAALGAWQVWLLCLLYFLMNIGSYGYEMWLPSIIKSFGDLQSGTIGLINAIPYFIAGVVMFLVGRHSDKTNERRGHVALSALSAAVGFWIAAYFKNPYIAMVGLIIAFSGIKSTIAPFWALTTSYLSGAAAAAGIALINSVGNLGGFVGPYAVGYFRDKTKNDVAALVLLGCALLGMAVFTFLSPKPRKT